MPDGCIVLATRNRGKLREIRQVLGDLSVEMVSLEDFPEIPDPEETGSTFAENARIKALGYAKATRKWALAEDSGLVVDALDGAPGVRSARYATDRVAPDATREQIDLTNNTKLLEQLEGVPDEQRSGRFVCHLALADPERILLEATGAIEGRIGHEPRGENGFGYDPVFISNQTGCTTAELSPEQKNAISHRGRAVRQFATLLREFLARLARQEDAL